jgi:TolB protein
MKFKTGLLLAFLLSAIRPFAQMQPVGQFDDHEDVGNPKISGSAVYNPENQTYLLSGAGKNIWTNTDQFQFVWKKIKGDFIIQATVQFIGEGAAGHRKIGIMARDRLTTDSRYADCSVHGGLPLLTALQYRGADGDTTAQVVLSSYHPTEIQFQRRIIIPADKNFRPYQDYIGSNLEVMDVATGLRKILYSDPSSLQAPVWTPDDKDQPPTALPLPTFMAGPLMERPSSSPANVKGHSISSPSMSPPGKKRR